MANITMSHNGMSLLLAGLAFLLMPLTAPTAAGASEPEPSVSPQTRALGDTSVSLGVTGFAARAGLLVGLDGYGPDAMVNVHLTPHVAVNARATFFRYDVYNRDLTASLGVRGQYPYGPSTFAVGTRLGRYWRLVDDGYSHVLPVPMIWLEATYEYLFDNRWMIGVDISAGTPDFGFEFEHWLRGVTLRLGYEFQ